MVGWNRSERNRRKGWWSRMAKHLICIVRTKCDQCIWCNKLHRNKINPNLDINKFWLVDGIIWLGNKSKSFSTFWPIFPKKCTFTRSTNTSLASHLNYSYSPNEAEDDHAIGPKIELSLSGCIRAFWLCTRMEQLETIPK